MIYIRQDTYDEIMRALGTHEPECGGVLGARPGMEISAFYFDMMGRSNSEMYIPNVEQINSMLEEDWAPRGLQMVGMIHSHGNAGKFPSCGDLYYCEQIMKNAEITTFYLPIVTKNPFEMNFFQVTYQNEKLKVEQKAIELIS